TAALPKCRRSDKERLDRQKVTCFTGFEHGAMHRLSTRGRSRVFYAACLHPPPPVKSSVPARRDSARCLKYHSGVSWSSLRQVPDYFGFGAIKCPPQPLH